jgi:hypothetical protein
VLQERDYRYGAGTLIIRIDYVQWDSPDLYDDEPWYFVEGVRFSTAGATLGQCQVMVRGRVLKADGPAPSAG